MPGGIIIVCGGTGGHLSPGIGTAQRLREGGHEVELVVSEKEVDSRILDVYPEFNYRQTKSAPFRLFPPALFRFLYRSLHGFVTALAALRRERPSVVLAFGGHTSVSYVIAARVLRIPVVLHEANRLAGRSIRFLSRMAEYVFLPEGVGLPGIEPRRIQRLGMPLRREVTHIPKDKIRRELEIPGYAKVLVVVGGSQGAQVLNEWVAAHYRSLAGDGIWVILVAGPGKNTLPGVEVLKSDQGEPVELRTSSFHDRLYALFSCADLVVSRAGAGTIAELVACLTPGILVPYPFAADDHQFANARHLERRGGAILVCQSEIGSLYREVLDLIFNDWLLDRMRSNLRTLNRGDASASLAGFLEKHYCPEAGPKKRELDPVTEIPHG
ncbi:MAG: UDP-N-acetylglucosamine--N-acetylmuramyl-(pentapeptide) pyrophosphoryl-undecaprenol N-acetylglucosamine transferase [Oceanipulchritudo sp.]